MELQQAILEMQKCVNCLALELHEAVHGDVVETWNRLKAALSSVPAESCGHDFRMVAPYLMWCVECGAIKVLFRDNFTVPKIETPRRLSAPVAPGEVVRNCETCGDCPDDGRKCTHPDYACWTPKKKYCDDCIQRLAAKDAPEKGA